MLKSEIQNKIKELGLNIESEEITENELKFYCNDGDKRFFISIKDKVL